MLSNAGVLLRTTCAIHYPITWSTGVHVAKYVRTRIAAQDAIACELLAKCGGRRGICRRSAVVGVAFAQCGCRHGITIERLYPSNMTSCSRTICWWQHRCMSFQFVASFTSAMVYSAYKQQRILHLSYKFICYLCALERSFVCYIHVVNG